MDTSLNNFGAQADSQIDNELYKTASKNARLTALPVLPLASPIQSIKDAATDRATALFFLQQHQLEISAKYMEQSKQAVSGYVERLEADQQIYGVII